MVFSKFYKLTIAKPGVEPHLVVGVFKSGPGAQPQQPSRHRNSLAAAQVANNLLDFQLLVRPAPHQVLVKIASPQTMAGTQRGQ